MERDRLMRYAIGVDLGGTNVKLVAVTETGDALERVTERTVDSGSEWAECIRSRLARIEAAHGGTEFVGVAAPGLAARDGRSIAWMRGRMAGVQDFDWTARLERRRTVPVLNDAHAAVLGEAWRGAAAGARNVVMLTLGTGVGGGAVVDGRLLRGHVGRAGHLGHISLDADGTRDIVGTPGSLEDAIGDCTVAQRSGGRFTSTALLLDAYRAGDQTAAAVWSRSVERLAVGISSLINVLDPEVVVIGGGIARAGNDLFRPLAASLDRVEWRPLGAGVAVVPAALGEFAGAFGAAYHTLHANIA
jgi:glucokinase